MSNNIFQDAASLTSVNQTYLNRPIIHDLLEESVQNPVTTIIAGAGYGKTQAVYTFLQEYDAVTIWLQLSTFDNLIIRLWENFIYAISLQNDKLASDLISLGFPETTGAYDRLFGLFSDYIKQDKRYIIVYDDFHLIHEKIVLQFFELLMSAGISNLSTIIISRNEPDINTVGLLSKGLISNINEDDLRFSKSEIINYFDMQDISLSPKAVTDIYNYTDGWIFAIYLIRLTLRKGSVLENYALSTVKQNIFKLMENEIYYFVSKEMQEFLVKLSLLENMPLKLLKALFPDDEKLIGELGKISSVIRFDAFINTYRMHHFFLTFLSEKQSELKTGEKKKIYRKTANWYAKNGYKIDAIAYYEKIGCYDEIIDIAIAYPFPSPCPKKTADFMIELLKKIPKKIRNRRPIISVLHAKFLLNNFRVEESYTILLKLRQKYEALAPTNENKAILGEIYIILGFISLITCLFTGIYDFIQLFKMADELLPSGSIIVHRNLHLNSGNYICWVSHPEKGAYEKIHEALYDTMPYASRVMNGSGYGLEYLALAETSFFQKDFKDAEKYAYQAIYKAQEKEQFDIENMAAFFLIRINIATGNYKMIFTLLEQLKLLSEKQNCLECYTLFDIAKGWFYASIGQTQKVARWIIHDPEENDVTSPITFALDRIVRAKYYLAEKKYYELLAFIEQRNDQYSIENFLVGLIEMTVLKAIAMYHIGEQKKALIILQEAYDLAHVNCLVMPFIEQGSSIHPLINMAIHSKNCKIPPQWLETIYTKSSTYAKKLAYVISDYRILNSFNNDIQFNITHKEKEILTDLCHGLTREEIAVNCNMSINAVKRMLQVIFEKLGAKNTLETVRIVILKKLI